MFSAGRASAFAIRLGVGGRFAAVPFQILLQEAACDRGVVQRLFASHNVGRQMTLQRRQLREIDVRNLALQRLLLGRTELVPEAENVLLAVRAKMVRERLEVHASRCGWRTPPF